MTKIILKQQHKSNLSEMASKIKINQKQYKQIIMERLKRDSKNNSNQNTSKKTIIHNLKTQCTPNQGDMTQQGEEECLQYFADFDHLYTVKYQPINLKQKKPIKRCLLTQLLQIKKSDSAKIMNKRETQCIKNKQGKWKDSKKQIKKKYITECIQNDHFVRNFQSEIHRTYKNSQVSKNIRKNTSNSNKKLEQIYLTRNHSYSSLRNTDKDTEKSLKKVKSRKQLKQSRLTQIYKATTKPSTPNPNYLNILSKRNVKKN